MELSSLLGDLDLAGSDEEKRRKDKRFILEYYEVRETHPKKSAIYESGKRYYCQLGAEVKCKPVIFYLSPADDQIDSTVPHIIWK